MPTVERAERFLAEQPADGASLAGRRAVIGAPTSVRAGLNDVAREYGADEVMVVTVTHDHAARRRSYELIAEAFALAGAAVAASPGA